MSLMNSLEVARQALATQALTLETIAENLSRADDPSFSRRRIVRQSSPAAGTAGGLLTRQGPLLGAGPAVRAVVRERNQFVESRLRSATSESEEALVAERAWQSLEALFDEPVGPASLSRLWNDWENALQDLTGHPNDLGVRQVVLDRSADLATGIRRLAMGIADIRAAEAEALESEVTRVNTLIDEIARLNGAIRQAESGRGPRGEQRLANDLRDQRDARLRELAGLIDVTIREDEKAVYPGESTGLRVEIGGTVVVDGDQVLYHVQGPQATYDEADAADRDPVIRLQSVVPDRSGEDPYEIGSPAGAIRGRLQNQREADRLLSLLDQMAAKLIDGVNELHTQGVDYDGEQGLPLFVGAGAIDIAINEQVYDWRKLAASDGDQDNKIALELLDWARGSGVAPENHPLAIYQGRIVSALAESTRQAQERREVADARRQQFQDLRQSEIGVSPDEEMVTLLATEKAYQAAAQLIRTLDDALSTVIELLGSAGR
jgi:flagellar hook-associated protein 1 FlgK